MLGLKRAGPADGDHRWKSPAAESIIERSAVKSARGRNMGAAGAARIEARFLARTYNN